MKTYLIILLTICFALMTGSVFAQCPTEDITLSSQQEVDDFTVLYPNCTEIVGDLRIGSSVTTPYFIEDLSPLNHITSIGGILTVGGNDTLVTLTGLDNITSIGSSLHIYGNDSLTDLSALANLTSIGSQLYISNNDALTNLNGLENINSTGIALSIVSNPSLTALTEFSNLSFLGSIDINNNDALTNLNGLDNAGIVIDLTIRNNDALTNLDALAGINELGGLSISNNDALTNLNGFGTFTLEYLYITANDALTSLTGLNDITLDTQPSTDTLYTIFGNPNLSVCHIESICNFLAESTFIDIRDNASGCNAVPEVLSGCTSVWDSYVQGNIYADKDANCEQGTDETHLNNWLVKFEGEGITRYTYTHTEGNYAYPLDLGEYTITTMPPNSLWETLCPTESIITLSNQNPIIDVSFAASTSTFCPLLEIDVTAPIVRRCFDSNYYVRYCNSGTDVAEDAYVEVQLDPFFTYQNSTIAGIDLGDNLYSFDLENIDIGECGNFRIDVYVDCDSTELGQTHCVEAHIYPDSICTSTSPLWDESSIRVDAQCLGDSIEFKIENIGAGDMSDSLEYLIVEDDLIWHRANFQLDSGTNLKFYKPANGEFHRLEAEQSPGHPGNSMPSVFVEGCGVNDNGEISMGFVNYYLLDEGDAFVSIDCQENVGSYDPNDKQAFPTGYGDQHYITDSTNLEYMIRFQNTGTDTAFTVVIRDTISSYLNIETLRPGVASHSYRYDIEGSNVAVFHFDNIMLPDSNVNEVASHGFIKFNIEQQGNNPIGTHIMNDAAIYFDFNEPIITNNVLHTIGQDFIGVLTSVTTPPEVSEAGISVHVFPNPFDEYTRFEVQGKAVNELNLSLYDMMGRKVLQQQNSNQSFINLYKNHLPPGVYVFKLIDEKQQLATGKLVVK